MSPSIDLMTLSRQPSPEDAGNAFRISAAASKLSLPSEPTEDLDNAQNDALAADAARLEVAHLFRREPSSLPITLADCLRNPTQKISLDYREIRGGLDALREADGYGDCFGFYPLDDLRPSRQACLFLAHIDETARAALARRDKAALAKGWTDDFMRLNDSGFTKERERAATACLVLALVSVFSCSEEVRPLLGPKLIADLVGAGMLMATAASVAAYFLTRPFPSAKDRERSNIEMETSSAMRARLIVLAPDFEMQRPMLTQRVT